MNSSDLTTAQAQVLYDALRPTLAYLFRLEARMQQAGFSPDDRLYHLVVEAHNAIHSLSVETEHLSNTPVDNRAAEE